MNRNTLISVVIALGSLALAIAMRPVELAAVAYEDTGTALFPSFSDPAQASSLEVTGWDDTGARVTNFKVEQKAGRWVIPSHNDYPADGTERMGKAAASFIDVNKDLYYGDNAAEHGQYGVLDPESADGKGDEKGKHITIKDASGATLVAIIVGKEIPDGTLVLGRPAHVTRLLDPEEVEKLLTSAAYYRENAARFAAGAGRHGQGT